MMRLFNGRGDRYRLAQQYPALWISGLRDQIFVVGALLALEVLIGFLLPIYTSGTIQLLIGTGMFLVAFIYQLVWQYSFFEENLNRKGIVVLYLFNVLAVVIQSLLLMGTSTGLHYKTVRRYPVVDSIYQDMITLRIAHSDSAYLMLLRADLLHPDLEDLLYDSSRTILTTAEKNPFITQPFLTSREYREGADGFLVDIDFTKASPARPRGAVADPFSNGPLASDILYHIDKEGYNPDSVLYVYGDTLSYRLGDVVARRDRLSRIITLDSASYSATDGAAKKLSKAYAIPWTDTTDRKLRQAQFDLIDERFGAIRDNFYNTEDALANWIAHLIIMATYGPAIAMWAILGRKHRQRVRRMRIVVWPFALLAFTALGFLLVIIENLHSAILGTIISLGICVAMLATVVLFFTTLRKIQQQNLHLVCAIILQLLMTSVVAGFWIVNIEDTVIESGQNVGSQVLISVAFFLCFLCVNIAFTLRYHTMQYLPQKS